MDYGDGGIPDDLLLGIVLPVAGAAAAEAQQQQQQVQQNQQVPVPSAAQSAALQQPATQHDPLQQARADLTAAEERANAINAAKAVQEQILADLKLKYQGRSGSYRKADAAIKRRADAALKLLLDGVLPEEQEPPAPVRPGLQTAREDPMVAARLALPQRAPAGR
jgi:ribosomal protein L17